MTDQIENLCRAVLREGAVDGSDLEGRNWPAEAETMIGRKRLDNFVKCIKTAIEEGIPGDIIETGVWRGGACIVARGVLDAMDDYTRKVFVADSFQGLPPPDARYPADRGDKHFMFSQLAISLETVKANFERYGLLDSRVCFLKGWFEDTLPGPVERLAVMRLDGDMYSSTIHAIEALYPLLSPGGFCIIDDYALPGAQKAVNDFRNKNEIYEPIKGIDWTGAWWRKKQT